MDPHRHPEPDSPGALGAGQRRSRPPRRGAPRRRGVRLPARLLDAALRAPVACSPPAVERAVQQRPRVTESPSGDIPVAHLPPSEPPAKQAAEHKPFVPPESEVPEFTPKAVVLGAAFGIIFGAVTVYLALRAGLTVSASIPIAVLAIAVFKRIGRSTILENNIVQTIGSAGESIAAGVVFTIPAFLFIAEGRDYFNYLQIMTLAAVGGILGVLLMVPMRRALIVKEHGALPYPEGTACAEVLVAGEKGGSMARMVFAGFWVSLTYTILQKVGLLWKETFRFASGPEAAHYKNATLTSEVTPEYLGVGYIIGPRIAGIMVSGSVLSWLALIPLLSMFVGDATVKADLARLGFTQVWIDTHTPAEWFYRAYIRYIGAGAVAMAGLLTLLRTMPTIVASVRDSLRDLRQAREGSLGGVKRTERDLPMTWVLGGSVALALIIAVLPNLPAGGFPASLLTGLLILLFGFLFVAVSSRIVGLIGSSSNPISGMTIATLLGTCLIFLSLGMSGDAYQGAALCVGAIVCIAAANAGATSQDLKTGFLVGATPIRQQVGLVIGVVVSVGVIGLTLVGLHESTMGPIGGEKLPAPQGTLMATIIKGVLSRDLPWGFIVVGAALALVVQLCGVSGLAWAVGAYLPISTTFPIFVGGAMRWLSDRIRGEKEESELSSGMLFSTGLVAGGSIAGLLVAIVGSLESMKEGLERAGVGKSLDLFSFVGHEASWSALLFFAILCAILVRKSLKKLEA
ncbi:MAG: oligopeptide transporter, OPT family [Planctomycetes bacterium]|nr:oligopeptide transporter, OPT family [Planctomycetota bacterium]